MPALLRFSIHRVRPLARLLALVGVAALAACGGAGDGGSPTTAPPITPAPVVPGILGITLTGLPAGVNGDIVVSGVAPSTFSRTATGTIAWTDIPVGRYTVTVRPVRTAAGTFTGAPASTTVDVAAAAAATVTLAYRPAPSSLALTISGVPSGVTPGVTLTVPGGGTAPVTGSGLFTAPQQEGPAATADRWKVSAAEFVSAGTRFIPTPAALDTTVSLGDTARVAVRYAVGSGAIAVVVAGLPAGVDADARLIAPDNTVRPITVTTTITGLDAGRYRLVANSLVRDGITYRPSSDTLSLDVALSLVATPATLTYTAQAGRLAVTVIGVPVGAAPGITLTGPGGSRPLSGSTTFDTLPNGSYTLTAPSFVSANQRYAATPASQTATITTGARVAASIAYAIAPTTVDVTITGLPTGSAAAVTLTSPTGESIAVSRTTTIAPAAAGRWRLAAASVNTGTATYDPTPTSYDQTVVPGDGLVFPVQYTLVTGALAVVVEGLPAGATGAVQVTGPAGFSRTLTATTTLTNLVPGSYTVTGGAISANGDGFAPSRPAQTVTVGASLVATPATVTYRQTTGALTVALTGVPAGSTPSVTVTGPNGFSRVITASGTLSGIPAGDYTLTAVTLSSNGADFNPAPGTQTVAVAAAATASASIAWSQAAGSLVVTINGVPAGSANVSVTGPNGFSRALSGTATLAGLLPGVYTVTSTNVTSGGNTFAGVPTSQQVTVAPTNASAAATVTYGQTTGSLALAVTGLPAGSSGSVTITGPASFNQTLTATTTLTGLIPGTYTVTAATVTIAGQPWTASPTSQSVTVSPTPVAGAATVRYAQNPGALAITVNGLPNGSAAAITVSGPNGYTQSVTGSTTLSGISAGSYTVAAANVSASGVVYAPANASQSVTVSGGATAAATVTYAPTTGSLTVTVSGLPNGTSAAVTVTGPNNYSRAVTSTVTLGSLTPGTYTVAAASVTNGATTYTPSASSQPVAVNASGTPASATVTYTTGGGGGGGGGGVNYTLSNAYLTQAIQKPDGSVSLVANRDALLRVFVVANGANTARPDVRVRVYDGATLLQTNTIAAPEASVRQSIDEGTLGSTWNLLIPAANVRTTMRVLIDLDPTAAVADADRSDNTWPSNGTPRAISVVAAPTFTVRFVPVVTGALTGNVSNANKDAFLVTSRRIWPLQAVVSDVRAPFTSSATTLQNDDANGQWLTVLSEMNTLRTTDGAPATTHYYGVVKVSYTSGVAGYGYVPGRAAVGWDYLPSGDGVAAHEWGHNFSRQHAPCGTTGDPNYPYAGGVTSFWGWNSTTNVLVSPTATDVMSYCSNNWVSDYNWSAVLSYRAANGGIANGGIGSALVAGTTEKQDGLLIWGRVVNGTVQLEPAFRVTAPITPAARRPTHRVDLLDDADNALLQLPIEAELVDHVQGREERQFAVVVPWSAALEDRLQSIRVADSRVPLRSVSRRASFPSPAAMRTAMRTAGAAMRAPDIEPADVLATDVPGRVRVSWRNGGYGMAMVRDAATGQVMGYVRQPGAAVATGGRAVEVVFSDGVRSVVRQAGRATR